MPYKITIEKTHEVRCTLPKRWEVIGEKEVARDTEFIHTAEEKTTRIETIRGYTPEVETIQTETVKILEQSVDELDLPAVIRAINKL